MANSDPHRFTLTDYAYDREEDTQSGASGQGGYSGEDFKPLQEGQEVLQASHGGSGGPSGALGPPRDPPVLAAPITSPTSSTIPSSSSTSSRYPNEKGKPILKPSISAKTGTSGYVPRKGKDAFPIPDSAPGSSISSPTETAGGQYHYSPISPAGPGPGPSVTSPTFRRLPNVPGAGLAQATGNGGALAGRQASTSTAGAGSLLHSASLSSRGSANTAFPSAKPLSPPPPSSSSSGHFPSLGSIGRDGRNASSIPFPDPSLTGQQPVSSLSPGISPYAPHTPVDFSQPRPSASRSNSASNLLPPPVGSGFSDNSSARTRPFQPLPSAALSDVSSSSRPAYPSMPSTSTELPTLPSVGRSYRGSAISGTGAGRSDWAEEGIEVDRYKHRQDDEDGDGDEGVDVKEKESMKQLAFVEPAVQRDITWRRFLPKTMACKLLLFVVIFELVVDLTIEGNILYRFNGEVDSTNASAIITENKRRLPIYLIIFGLAHLWQLVLTVISIRTKNTIQVSAVTLFNFAFLAWAVIQVNELQEILGDLNSNALALDGTKPKLITLPLNILTGIIIAVVAAGCLALSVLTYVIRKEFGWQRYRFLGADLAIRKCYQNFQVFECVCYFSAFFCAGFGIQFVWLVLQPTDIEYIITIVALPVSLLLLTFGRLAAKYENKPCMILFLLGNFLGVGYFTFKLVRIWQQSKTVYITTSKSLTVFAALSVLTLVGLMIWGVIVYNGFGKGLRREICGKEFWRRYVGKNRARGKVGGTGGVDEERYVRDIGQGQGREGKRGGVGEKGMVQMKRLSID